MRFFGGPSVEETAGGFDDLTRRGVMRDWKLAKADRRGLGENKQATSLRLR
jgi:hypothetical protein